MRKKKNHINRYGWRLRDEREAKLAMNAVYTRQSLDVKDSLSIESQLDACLNENGSAAYRHYNDKGYSGKNTERPAFQQLMADVRKGTIERVIVYRLDRLSRSLLDFAEMIDVFKKKDVEFVSCREKFDTSTPIGNAIDRKSTRLNSSHAR